jgi:phosphatidylglycerol:prolipoprotein diacylglycerol transferase
MISEIPFPAGFTLLGKTGISTYSILLMIAFLVASYLAPRELRRRGLDPEAADWSLLLAVVGAIVGSKVFFIFEIWHKIWIVHDGFWETFYYVFFHYSGMKERFPGTPGIEGLWENLLQGGGLVFYGGFLVSFASIYLYLRWRRYSIWRYGDAFMPSLALGYAIGRLGCMVSGDGCYGYGASVSIPLFTMVYGPADGQCGDPHAWWLPYMCSAGVRVWNTPLMESVLSTGLFAFLMLWVRHQRFRPGMMVAIFLIFNGLARFAVEFLRINDAVIPLFDHPTFEQDGVLVDLVHHNDRYLQHPPDYYFRNWHWYGFTQSQIMGLVLVFIGGAWIGLRKLWLKDEQPDPVEKSAH